MEYNYKSEFPSDTGIYKIWFIDDTERIYIGSALSFKPRFPSDKGFNRRWKVHLYSLKTNRSTNSKLQNSFNKYGIENIRFSIIEICNPSIGLEREQFWVDYYNVIDDGLNCKYKVNSNLGLKTSKKTKEKLSEIGKKRAAIELEKIKIKYNNEIVTLYNSIKTYKEIAEELKIPYNSIGKILRINNIKPRHKTYKHLKLLYCYDLNFFDKKLEKNEIDDFLKVKEIEDEISEKRKLKKSIVQKRYVLKNIRQYDLNGNLLKIWKSGKEVKVAFKMNTFGPISSVIRNEKFKYKNFIWKLY